MTVPVVDPALTERLTRDLVRINSVNPDLVPGARGETEVVEFLEEEFKEHGISTERVVAGAARPSIVATLPGKGNGKSLMLNAHVDTVGVDGMDKPFSGDLRDGCVHGRGSYDMKGAMAACVAAAITLKRSDVQLPGDLVVTGVADEEFASLGMSAVIDHIKTDGAIVTEPTHLKVCRAHKGFVWLRVETKGRAAHGSRFQDGIDANLAMGRILGELANLEQRVRSGRQHALLGPGSLHAATLHGGTGVSTYADRCVLEIERRTIPGETAQQVEQEVQDLIDGLRSIDPDLNVSLKTTLVRDPFEIDASAQVVTAVDSAVLAVTERQAEHMGDAPWMDSALLAAAGVETVVIGPSGAGAHASEEWVDVQSVTDLANILIHSAVNYCTA
jgi:acetylornithine deacetylase